MDGKKNKNKTQGIPKKGKIYSFPFKVNSCLICEIETIFQFEKNIGHSYCVRCGNFGPDSKRRWGTLYKEKKL